jgi:hypothetical protein
VEVAISASYLGSLLYWLVSFAQKEPPRPVLPEHAKDVLSELAQTARGQHVALKKRRGAARRTAK